MTIIIIILTIFSFALHHYFNKSINERIKTELDHKARSVQDKLLSHKLIADKMVKIIHGKNVPNSFKIIDKGEYLNVTYTLKIDKPFKGAIRIFKNHIDDKAEDLSDTMLFLDPVFLVILFIFSWKLVDKIVLPIKMTTKMANHINVSDLSEISQIPLPKYDDEIRELIMSFNGMIKRLKTGVENIDKFNDNVSHELKTPITAIKGEIEIALMKKRDFKYYENTLQVISLETEKINSIINDLLLLTKYSKENISSTFKNINLNNILLDIIDDFDHKVKKKALKLHIQNFENITLRANETLVKSLFSNLLDNAIKYTNENKNIYLSLSKSKFIIKDEGIGIDKNDLSKITQRFYRVDKSRNKQIEGFGLGLSIVKNSVYLQNWRMKISSNLHEGTTVEIFF